MSYKVTEENNISTVYLDGEIDMDVTERVKEVIMPLIEAKKEVHLNLKDVQYMDSSGISVLIESHQKATELGTKVTLKEISKSVVAPPALLSDQRMARHGPGFMSAAKYRQAVSGMLVTRPWKWRWMTPTGPALAPAGQHLRTSAAHGSKAG